MRTQSGQAIALVALIITVLIGMVALAVDGARAYALRRDLQAAVDAAALAAADRLQQTDSYSSAEQAATSVFGSNLRLYSAPSCSPGYASPGATPLTITCTYPDQTALTDVASNLGQDGSLFRVSATRPLQLAFAGLLTNGAAANVGSTATAAVNNLLYAPAIAALDPAGCGGTSGNAISVTGGGTLNIVGDVVSAGAMAFGTSSVTVAGDVYARCQSSIPSLTSACYPSGAAPPCTSPDVAGAVIAGFRPTDPNYPLPAVTGGSQPAPGNDVMLSPGSYAADPAFGSGRCYFLAGGVYEWVAGYTNSSGFVSNELKPPDEPAAGNNTVLAHQMWDTGGVNCAGSFQVSSPPAVNAIREGVWAIEVTATRTAVYNGVSFRRESAPSMCRSVTVGDGQVLKVAISNVPGATAYNVYAAPPASGCSGPFGFAGSIQVTAPVHNDSTASCPAFSGTACSLGNESAIFDSTLIGLAFAPTLAAPDTPGAPPPSGETPPLKVNLPNQDPARATPPAGDRANENYCTTAVGTPTACPGPITPGAVEFYLPAGGCLNATTSADNFLFSGYQYDWIMVYEPGAGHPPSNTCTNTLGAEADSAWVGLIYMPSAALIIKKAATFRTDATGGLMADTITFQGQLPTIEYSAAYAPMPPASRLTG